MNITSRNVTLLFSTARAEARAHRAARAQHRKLRGELAAYSTPSEINDLMVALEGAGDEAVEVRDILMHNMVDYYRMRSGLSVA